MLRIVKQFGSKTPTDSEAGDINQFLQNILVEVATENYRQLMYEKLFLSGTDSHLDPPLRSNERILSGVFAIALSKIAARSRTEVRIDRSEYADSQSSLEKDKDEESSNTPKKKSGQVDFLAWYGKRVIAIELKMAGMDCSKPELTNPVCHRWDVANKQAKEAQTYLRVRQKEDGGRYPSPVSLALMVIVGRCSVPSDKQLKTEESDSLEKRKKFETEESNFLVKLRELEPTPSFVALYTFPEEFRRLAHRKEGKPKDLPGKEMYTPFVGFVARTHVNREVAPRSWTEFRFL